MKPPAVTETRMSAKPIVIARWNGVARLVFSCRCVCRLLPGRGRFLGRRDLGQPDEGNRHHPRHEEDGQYQAREVQAKHVFLDLHYRRNACGLRREA